MMDTKISGLVVTTGECMKLKNVAIRNFKGIETVEFSMVAASSALRSLTALIGDNGSGKTSILQAIALTLSLATRRTHDMTSFNWHGFLPERVSTLGSCGPARLDHRPSRPDPRFASRMA